ncbi:MAG: DUF3052 domain-containing protein [Actinobacteria bacterium]|nr:DUF3052 domain-containing protein [Actinomycetota bacterium]
MARARQTHRDYSGTPLPKKLGVREGSRVLIVNAPGGLDDALRPLPAGAGLVAQASTDLDVIVVFATSQADLERRFAKLLPSLATNGRLWVAWPKKASGIPTDVTFGSAQGVGLGAGLVDNKSASITDDFQGVQFVYRLKDRRR